MNYLDIVIALTLIQFIVFSMLTGRARGLYKVKAPAVTGHDLFERTYRVQMNTLELLIVLIPSLMIAAKYWSPMILAGLGCVYLIGRVVYYIQYTDPSKDRGIGYGLSFMPVVIVVIMALVGAVMK